MESKELEVPKYRPGKAVLQVMYSQGQDRVMNQLQLIELGDEAFYNELFLGHFKSVDSPEEVQVTMFNQVQTNQFIKQLKSFDGCEDLGNDTFWFNGVKIVVR